MGPLSISLFVLTSFCLDNSSVLLCSNLGRHGEMHQNPGARWLSPTTGVSSCFSLSQSPLNAFCPSQRTLSKITQWSALIGLTTIPIWFYLVLP